MVKTNLIVLLLSIFPLIRAELQGQNQVFGEVKDISSVALPGARITLFNGLQSYFQEERTNLAGAFSFSNIPDGTYFLGVEKIGKDYLEQQITLPVDSLNITLQAESNPGSWEVIVQSPEPLGGTDLGVLLPDGRIYYCHNTKDPFYFDPILNDTIAAFGSDSIQGCVGPLLEPGGKVWFVGGTLQEVYGPGTRKVKWFDPITNAWKTQPKMLDYRWYPSVAFLPDGNFLVAGGGNLNNPQRTKTAEIYNPQTGFSFFTGDMAIGNEVSPMVVLYNGKVLMTHRPPQLFDPETNQWTNAASFVQSPRTPNGDHSDCELVLMPDGEAIAIGYKTFTTGVYGSFVERYDPLLDEWRLGTSLLPIRSRAKTCLLPDKKILVMGGYKEDTTSTNTNQWGYMKLTDLYDPATDTWRRLEDLNYYREYHALSILVPDGRVIMVGGEGQPGNEPPFSVIEAFKPPYLFRGVRPEIQNLNTTSIGRGGKIEFDFAKTDSVTEVILMSNAVVTHFMNSGTNRYLSLPFEKEGNHILATLPSDSVKLIPGYYMLFIMVDDIPSVGQILEVKNEVISAIEPELDQKGEIILSPNPATGLLSLHLPETIQTFDVDIYDSVGRMMIHARNQKQIDINSLQSGLYYLRISNGKLKQTKKFLKL